MVNMLPTPSDNGARLAAILPTALASMGLALSQDPREVLRRALAGQRDPQSANVNTLPNLPAVKSIILIVVDGLGTFNLTQASGHARTLSTLPTRRIETVIPSTTGAALTTITTATLPGHHGLVGYKIRHPELGLLTTLKDWQGIENHRSWQRAEPLFGLAAEIGARPVAIGRPAHATGGLTEAILTGAEYHGGQTIVERFAIASRLVRAGDPLLAYLYIDELDRAAHSDGWRSLAWLRRLEQFDAALSDLLRTLPPDVGVVVTADHGMIDIDPDRRLLLDDGMVSLEGVHEIGGEPRMRSLYLADPRQSHVIVPQIANALGKRAWVGSREEAIQAGWFGPIDQQVAARLGDIIVAARGGLAFMLSDDSASALAMVGQHGGLSDEERGVPLALGGELAETGFAKAVTAVAHMIAH